MHKLFDKTLASRIKEVFQNHHEEYRPDDWEKLRVKMNNKQKRIFIGFPFIAKAASVALFLGLSVFSLNDLKHEKQNIIGAGLTKPNIVIAKNTLIDKNESTDIKFKKQDTVIVLQNKKVFNEEMNNKIVAENEIEESDDRIILNSDTIFNAQKTEDRFANIKQELAKQREEIQKMDSSKPDSSKINLYNDETEFDIVDEPKDNKHFIFGVEVASVSNYAIEGTGSSLNVGGGISTSWNITKNFSFSTGMIIARQSMNYNQNESTDKLMAQGDAAYDKAFDNSIGMVDVNTAESKLEFVGIDIPLNMQFKHKRMIVTTGLSSLLFVQEKYSYSYNSMVTNTSYNTLTSRYETQSAINQVNEQEKTNMFSRFDFARLINIAIGYNIPLTKGDLVFEPYLKLPVGNISSQDIKMGSGGFAVRYNF